MVRLLFKWPSMWYLPPSYSSKDIITQLPDKIGHSAPFFKWYILIIILKNNIIIIISIPVSLKSKHVIKKISSTEEHQLKSFHLC